MEVAAWGFPLLLRPRERSIDRIDPGGSSRGQSWDLGAARSEPEPDGLFFFLFGAAFPCGDESEAGGRRRNIRERGAWGKATGGGSRGAVRRRTWTREA